MNLQNQSAKKAIQDHGLDNFGFIDRTGVVVTAGAKTAIRVPSNVFTAAVGGAGDIAKHAVGLADDLCERLVQLAESVSNDYDMISLDLIAEKNPELVQAIFSSMTPTEIETFRAEMNAMGSVVLAQMEPGTKKEPKDFHAVATDFIKQQREAEAARKATEGGRLGEKLEGAIGEIASAAKANAPGSQTP